MEEVDQVVQNTPPLTTENTDLFSESAIAEAKVEDTEPQAATTPVPGLQPNSNVAVKEEKEPEPTVPMDEAFTNAAEGINFDSVLNETGGSNSFNLSLDFGDDDMGNQAFLSGSTFGNASSGTDKLGTSQPTENTPTAPAGGGAFDTELQQTEGDANAFPDQGNTMEDLMGPGESSFDDLFMEAENLGDNSTGDLNQLEGDSLMNISELDDNWFT